MSHEQRVYSLFRRILRCGRTWPGSAEEKTYILQEARRRFREDSKQPVGQLERLLEEGEHRLEYAQHYQIPYPRLHYSKAQFKGRRMDIPK